jgi:hypothetical protein
MITGDGVVVVVVAGVGATPSPTVAQGVQFGRKNTFLKLSTSVRQDSVRYRVALLAAAVAAARRRSGIGT